MGIILHLWLLFKSLYLKTYQKHLSVTPSFAQVLRKVLKLSGVGLVLSSSQFGLLIPRAESWKCLRRERCLSDSQRTPGGLGFLRKGESSAPTTVATGVFRAERLSLESEGQSPSRTVAATQTSKRCFWGSLGKVFRWWLRRWTPWRSFYSNHLDSKWGRPQSQLHILSVLLPEKSVCKGVMLWS